MGFFNKIKEGLRKTRENISGSIETMLHSFTKIDEELFEELEELLVMGDVGIHTAERICEELRHRVKKEGVTDPNDVMGLLKEIVADMLSGGEELQIENRPAAILVIGVNGVGKTTTIGKIAARYKAEGYSVILGAADTFRAAAIDQLEIWSERAGVPLVKRDEGSDPASVVFDTIAKAKSIHADIMICDTAGRLHNKKNLMDELGKMSRIIDRELPGCDKEVLLVLDATTGQNAVNQAREFKNAAGITGIVLTKLDGTAKGGVVLAIREELQLPVKFIGVGEQLDDLQPFDAREFAEALFDNQSKIDEDTLARIAEQNARYDEYGELIEEPAEESEWETGTEAGDAAMEVEEMMSDFKEALHEVMEEEGIPIPAEEEPEEEFEEEFEEEYELPETEEEAAEEVSYEQEKAPAEPEPEYVFEESFEEPVQEAAEEEEAAFGEAQIPEEAGQEEPVIEQEEEEPKSYGYAAEGSMTQEEPEAQEEYEEEPHRETWAERRARKEREKAERRAQKEAEKAERRAQKEAERAAQERQYEEEQDSYEETDWNAADNEGLTQEELDALNRYEEEEQHRETREERRARKEAEKAERRAQKEAERENRRHHGR